MLLSFSCFSQNNSKPQYLFDKKEQFKIKVKDKNTDLYAYETDTSFIARFLKKEDIGVLSPSDKTKIIKELKNIKKQEIDTLKTIIIHFFYKENFETNGCCIDHYVTDKTYQKFIKKNKIPQFFLTEKDYIYGAENVYEDKNDVIRPILFKYPFFTSNYIIIKPDGNFYRELGEYKQDYIPKKLKKF